ncbi:hypothetical protein TIFTF001_044144 [Ficus carica]|uniref:Uncharacterized protein n=1 Tax=Ficus carica TaxID=3494 RepID=A0AA87ZJH0_FICCA|nr:hypothetical protein TIFTF001_044140 [Ficus carica]GMN27628.1 hypothetical protein TIFTF001_044144 [Ficus carica]
MNFVQSMVLTERLWMRIIPHRLLINTTTSRLVALNEKEPGVLDQQPTPNASKECHLFFDDSINGEDVLVAIGRAYMECVPTDIVHGIPLGEENVRVTITIP